MVRDSAGGPERIFFPDGPLSRPCPGKKKAGERPDRGLIPKCGGHPVEGPRDIVGLLHIALDLPTMAESEELPALVLDNGSGMIKGGFAGDDGMAPAVSCLHCPAFVFKLPPCSCSAAGGLVFELAGCHRSVEQQCVVLASSSVSKTTAACGPRR